MLPPDQLKNKFYKFHNAMSHSTNERRVFRQHIQRAIQQGRLKFDTPRKIKVDDNPFLKDQNMVDAKLFKVKTKVLTSARARETGTVDLEMQISADEYREIRRRRDQQKSRSCCYISNFVEQVAAAEGKGLSALVRRERISASTIRREI